MIQPAFEILNQRGTPMFFSDTFANIPTAGIVGRIFIRTDSPYGIYRDTGSAWEQIAGSGGGGISGSGVAGQVTFWDGTSSVSGSNNLWFDNASGKFLVGTNNTTGAGKLQVTSATGDDQLRVWGATSPSIRIDNAVSGATQRFVMGLATATNNFIQGSAAGDICISTASANPLLFGMWQTSNASEVMRISTGNRLLIGKTVDAGYILDINGNARINTAQIGRGNGSVNSNVAFGEGAMYNAVPTGGFNVAMGRIALRNNTSGEYNTAVGDQTAPNLTIGVRNTIFGAQSGNITTGNENTVLGSFAGAGITTGNRNIFIGYTSGGSLSAPTYVLSINSKTLTAANEPNEAIIYGQQSTTLSNQILRLNARTGVGLSADPISGVQFQIQSAFYLFSATGNVGINTSTDAGYKLDVSGTSRIAYTVGGSSNGFEIRNPTSLVFRTRGDGSIGIGNSTFEPPLIFPVTTNRDSVNQAGQFLSISVNNGTTATGATNGAFNITSGNSNTITSGIFHHVLFAKSNAPTSGTGVFNLLTLLGTINQTGGANGISRFIYIDPTLTSAADFRSIEWTNNSGWGIYGSGSAPNYVNGNLNIASTTNPGQKLFVNGSVRIDGQTAATAGGSAGLHLILNLDGTNYKIALLNV